MLDDTVTQLWLPDAVYAGPDGLQAYGKYQKTARPTVDLVLSQTPRYGTVLQAGGHIGLMALALAMRFTEVWTAEAAADNYTCLLSNTAEVPTIHALYGALGDGHPVALVRAKYSPCHYARGPGAVPCYRIDDLETGPLDALVLDLEGGELVALQHAQQTLRRDHPLVVVEEYPRWFRRYNRQPGDVSRFLAGFGYQAVGHTEMDIAYACA